MSNTTPTADEIWAILRETAAQQQRFQRESNERFTRIEQQQEATQRIVESNALALAETRAIVDSNARAISANSEAIAELRVSLREEVAELVTMIGTLSTSFSEMLEQGRAERLALSTEVRSLIAALRDRFGGNGHGQE